MPKETTIKTQILVKLGKIEGIKIKKIKHLNNNNNNNNIKYSGDNIKRN